MDEKKKFDNKKTATDNQWISTGQARACDESDRRDGPGGEDAKNSNTPVNPIMEGSVSPSEKIFRTTPLSKERPISSVYPVIDTDLARDNVENDLSDADLQDL